jgi:hypothetical protein
MDRFFLFFRGPHRASGHCFDFPSHQWNHRAIGTHHVPWYSGWCYGRSLVHLGSLLPPFLTQERSRVHCGSSGTGLACVNPHQTFEHLSRFRVGHPGGEPNQSLLRWRGQITAGEASLLIRGKKTVPTVRAGSRASFDLHLPTLLSPAYQRFSTPFARRALFPWLLTPICLWAQSEPFFQHLCSSFIEAFVRCSLILP